MKAKLCLMIGTAFVLTACAVSAPTKHTVTMTRIKSVDYGAYPKNYEQRIRQDLENRLLDFDSAKIKIILPPKKTYEISNKYTYDNDLVRRVSGWEAKAFYSVCVNVNAKNSYGGYTGWQTHRYKFWNNEQEYEQAAGSPCEEALATRDEIYINNYATGLVDIVP